MEIVKRLLKTTSRWAYFDWAGFCLDYPSVDFKHARTSTKGFEQGTYRWHKIRKKVPCHFKMPKSPDLAPVVSFTGCQPKPGRQDNIELDRTRAGSCFHKQ
jgi:hypothetical protein